jgi:hypothetical protein
MHGMHERMHGPWPPMEERPGVGPPAANPTAAPTPPPPPAPR